MRKRLEKDVFTIDGRKKVEYKIKRNDNFVPTTINTNAPSPSSLQKKNKKLDVSVEDVSNDTSENKDEMGSEQDNDPFGLLSQPVLS